MADDLNLECADNVADKADLVHRAACGDQRRGDRQEGIARADRIDYILRESGDGMDDPAPLEVTQPCLPWVTMIFAQSTMLLDQPARNVARDRHAVADSEPRLRRVDADVVGALDTW